MPQPQEARESLSFSLVHDNVLQHTGRLVISRPVCYAAPSIFTKKWYNGRLFIGKDLIPSITPVKTLVCSVLCEFATFLEKQYCDSFCVSSSSDSAW